MKIEGGFDANQHAPKQLGAIVPPGKWPFQISNTSIVPTKANDGGMFIVEFDTPQGRIFKRYNLWNQAPKAVEIAHGELSALCHATGIFKVDYANEGAALRGAMGMIEVALQDSDKPDGYTEVKRVFDKNGNEPGKAPAAPQMAPQSQGQVGQQQTPQAWGATQAQPNPNPQAWAPGPTQAGATTDTKPPWAK